MPTTAPADTFANRQIMLSLAYLTYCGDQITTPDPDAEIGDLISAGIKQIPVLCTDSPGVGAVPNWAQVWGPVSYTTPGSLYQDNLMYLAQNQQNKSQYVVAIRGTNHVSDLDWLMDDFDVLQQMPWPPGSTTQTATGLISESTSIALQVLLNMSSGGHSLLQYLGGVTGSAIDLWVTGHSLGGCLASAFGLYLTETVSTWDQSGQSTVSAVTFAAPTAGNAAFAGLVDNAFSATTFDRVQCSFDIVPLAWAAANIVDPSDSSSNIFDIYDLQEAQNEKPPGIDFSEMKFPDGLVWSSVVLGSVLPTVQGYFETLNYSQPAAAAPLLQGVFNAAYSVYDQDFSTTATAFQDQASYQHSVSYPTLLQVPQLTDPNIINETGSGSGPAAQATRPRQKFLHDLIVSAFNGSKYAKLTAPLAKAAGEGSHVE